MSSERKLGGKQGALLIEQNEELEALILCWDCTRLYEEVGKVGEFVGHAKSGIVASKFGLR